MKTGDFVALGLLFGIMSAKAELYKYGNGLWPRNYTFTQHDITVVMRTDHGFPHDGNVSEWSVFANGTGNITFQIWRLTPQDGTSFVLVANASFEIHSEGLHSYEVSDGLSVERGDFIGIHLDNSAMLTFSRPAEKCNITPYTQQAYFQTGKEVTFDEFTVRNCMVFPIEATVLMSSVLERKEETTTINQTSTEISDSSTRLTTQPQQPSPAAPISPKSMKFVDISGVTVSGTRLVNGRSSNEGIVLVKRNTSSEWESICDIGWNDASAGALCKMLGFTGGVGKYFPFFGHLENRCKRLGSVTCSISNAASGDCSQWQLGDQAPCHHGHEAAVQCTTEKNEMQHVFGYPAVPRQHKDHLDGVNVIIPHPHDTMPWTSGTIRYWSFYLSTDISNISNVSLQIWRQLDDTQYKFIGETELRGLKKGVHVKHLTGNDERIHFEAGDVIGIKFEGTNPIPYDYHPEPCGRHDNVDTIKILPTYGQLIPGQPYPFIRSSMNLEDCKMYSLMTSFVGSERFGSHTFSLGHSLYKVMTMTPVSWEGSQRACARELGDLSQLVEIESEPEFSRITGMLNAMNIHQDLWIGYLVGSETGEGFRKWAHCHPRKGQSCVYLSRPKADEFYDESSDVFYMYTDTCQSKKMFLCEKSPLTVVMYGEVVTSRGSHNPVDPPPGLVNHNATHPQPVNRNIVISEKVAERGPPSILVAPVTTAVLLFSCLFVLTIIHLYRKQKRKHSREGDISESTVRFVSLYDKAALSSMDC